ncbi:hypothetical protein VPH35_015494 [Triticum aestivum]
MQKTFQTGVPAMEHWISAILLVLHTRVLSNGVEIAAALSLVTFAKDWLKEQSHQLTIQENVVLLFLTASLRRRYKRFPFTTAPFMSLLQEISQFPLVTMFFS